MLKIINPIQFPDWDRFQKNNVSDDLGPIYYTIFDVGDRKIVAECGWGYTTAGREKMEFEFSDTGYIKACNWIEDRRLQLIKSLL